MHMSMLKSLSDSLVTPTETADAQRRNLLLAPLAPLLCALPLGLSSTLAQASKIDPNQTAVILPDAMKWASPPSFPPKAFEMATLFGNINEPGPYLVLVKWHPGYMSAPHTYVSDRLSYVVSGTWWVNSGPDFDPDNTIPVPAGSFVRRVAHTPHYDGVKRGEKETAMIAIYGVGPVNFQLTEPGKPAVREV
jgi:hypothetical protein